jgi:hypothetical protein
MKKRKNKRSDRPKEVIVVNITPKKRKIRILDLETDEKYVSSADELDCDDKSEDKQKND